MEELKVLIGMVADLPQMAIWVLIGFFVYKVVIIGSVFGLIKLAIVKLHSWVTIPKHELIVQDYTTKIDRLTVRGEADKLISQLERITGIRTSIETNHIHSCDIKWLSEAITEKIYRDLGGDKVHVVQAHRCGESDNTSYIVGVFDDEGLASRAATLEQRERGQKYDCDVVGWELNSTDNTMGKGT